MRVINLNGYIDEEVWYGDEITPDILHDQLFAEGEDHSLPVRIILNSYGGSCNAAVRMFDDVRAYPGDVHIIVSGTAASAATVLAMAADRLEMTPGSMWMIHDPSVFAFGNEHDLNDAIRMLNEAAQDPDVLSIKMTLYRLARDSKVVEALVDAISKNGSQEVPPLSFSVVRKENMYEPEHQKLLFPVTR